MATPYLTPEQATTRLSQYSIVATPTAKELELASDRLDLLGAFIGAKYAEGQVRAFPRTATVVGDTEGEVPSKVLDWVAITAYELQEEDEPPVKHERISSLSVTYTRGRINRPTRVKRDLLRAYRIRSIITIT